jgi:Zn-finger nucleic acid-binding protein
MSTCPHDRSPLTAAAYEGVAVQTCGRCAGQWLDADGLKAIIDTREKTWDRAALEAVGHRRLPGAPVGAAQEDLPCPDCGATMTAFNYGGDTGIILDRCRQCGGIWLDGGELEKVQMAVEGAELDLGRDVRRFSAQMEQAAVRQDNLERQDSRASRSPLVAAIANRIVDVDNIP